MVAVCWINISSSHRAQWFVQIFPQDNSSKFADPIVIDNSQANDHFGFILQTIDDSMRFIFKLLYTKFGTAVVVSLVLFFLISAPWFASEPAELVSKVDIDKASWSSNSAEKCLLLLLDPNSVPNSVVVAYYVLRQMHPPITASIVAVFGLTQLFELLIRKATVWFCSIYILHYSGLLGCVGKLLLSFCICIAKSSFFL